MGRFNVIKTAGAAFTAYVISMLAILAADLLAVAGTWILDIVDRLLDAAAAFVEERD